MTYIPAETRREWRTAMSKSDHITLNILLDLRDILDENKDTDGNPKAPVAAIYDEAAEVLCRKRNTLERKIRHLSDYPRADLIRWMSKGVSFDHFEEDWNFRDKYPKGFLLDKAIELGAPEGNKPMTADELYIFANGGEPPKRDWITRIFDGLGKFPYRLKWDTDKTTRFQAWLQQGNEFFAEAQ